MRESVFILICFLSILVSCQSPREQTDIIIDDEYFEPDMHTAEISLDYFGIYQGVLPCADCEGIDTQIELGPGNSYIKRIIYLGKSEEEVFETTGTFSWNEGGNTITLEGENQPNQYFVGENILFHLDMEGNRITGDLAENYQLKKQ